MPWKSPKSKSARRVQEHKCGKKCFLIPNELKFPICNSNCVIERSGVEAAYRRAREWKYDAVAQKAYEILHPLPKSPTKNSMRLPSARLQGGGREEFAAFRVYQMNHHDIRRLGPNKPVATTISSLKDQREFFDRWEKLNEEEKSKLRQIDFDVDIDKSASVSANKIVFYSPKYLQMLAEASKIPVNDLLRMIHANQSFNESNMDIIKIAFGDLYYEDAPFTLTTSNGKEILRRYNILKEGGVLPREDHGGAARERSRSRERRDPGGRMEREQRGSPRERSRSRERRDPGGGMER